MKNNSPDWSKSAQWNEYDWEIAMRSSDDFASKYFHLLNQYGDFPGAEDYILSKLDETACPPSPSSAEDYEIEEFFDSQSSDEEENDEEYSSIYYETDRSYRVLRQVAIGWCNIFATHLKPEEYLEGVHLIYSLGRAVAHLASSLADGRYENPAVHIASGKRAMAQLNNSLGLVAQLPGESNSALEIRQALTKHLCEVQQGISDHLIRLQTMKVSS